MERVAQAAPERVGIRRLVPPRPLAVLLALVAIVGLAWALTVPPWQSPDETTHFAYAQGLAENFALPGAPNRPTVSDDQAAADTAVGASRGAFYPQSAPPDWSRTDYRAYQATLAAHPPPKGNGGGALAADSNPPLYYLYADIGYLIDHGGTAFGRLYAMRISGVVLLLLTTLGAWLVAGETLGRRRVPQLAAAAVAGLLPMETFMSTAVNPDALLVTLWTLALWLGARVINRGARWADALALGAVTAAAILTKATSYALVPAVLFALVVGWRRRPAPESGSALAASGAALVVLAAPVLGWVALTRSLGRAAINTVAASPAHPFRVSQFLSYVWQFYLPRLPFLTRFNTVGGYPAYHLWLVQGLGVFGWLDVFLPNWIYRAAAVVVVALGLAVVLLLIRLRDARRLTLLGFFALAVIALLGLLHITEYRAIIAGANTTFLQGRYLLPVVALLGLSVGFVLSRVPKRGRPLACALVLTGMLTLQAVALATVVQAYYL